VKENTHPIYYPDAKIVCACGTVHGIGSTKKDIRVEICSKCHPFYTGQRRIVDTAGRVERFVRKYNWGQQPTDDKKVPKVKKGAEEALKILEELEGKDAK
jgi:large subunit ribosomal protein L31